jgi:hypothetical protein
MPLLTEKALIDLLSSLDRYDERRMRDTIELARDSETATQLLDWLQKTISDNQDLEWCDRLSTISIAMALAENGAPGLMKVLLDRVVNNPCLFTDELFEYVLKRMGEPMIREAMRLLPDVQRPLGRAELYYLMDSVHLLPLPLQREVADFCFARVPIELELPADRKGNTAWYACCRLMVTLADARLGAIIIRNRKDITRRKRRENWDRLWTSFNRYLGEPMKIVENRDPRIDWPALMPLWNQVYVDANATYGDPEVDEMFALVDGLGNSSPSGSDQQADGTSSTASTALGAGPKIGRNGPCPCGSGKKYKKCCGA